MLRAVANIPEYIGSFTFANLPAASSYSGFRAFCSDLGANGTDVRSNGTRWRPVNGRATLKDLGAAVTGIANTETIVLQALIPAGAWKANDTLKFRFTPTKSGTTDALSLSIRIGTAGTTSDTAILPFATFQAAAGQSGGYELEIKLTNNTTAQRIGAIGSVTAYQGTSSVAAVAPVTISDASANALYASLSLASGGTTNTVGTQSGQIELLTP